MRRAFIYLRLPVATSCRCAGRKDLVPRFRRQGIRTYRRGMEESPKLWPRKCECSCGNDRHCSDRIARSRGQLLLRIGILTASGKCAKKLSQDGYPRAMVLRSTENGEQQLARADARPPWQLHWRMTLPSEI